jgi:tricorn protease
MWMGDKVYFISDRDGPLCAVRYDTKTKKVDLPGQRQRLDIKTASAWMPRNPGTIAFEQFGTISLLT